MRETEYTPEKLVNIKERVGSWRTDIKFNQMTEEKFEKDHEIEVYDHMKRKLIIPILSCINKRMLSVHETHRTC